MGSLRKLLSALCRPPTLKTLSTGSIFIVALHFIIKFEQIKESADFQNLNIPIEPGFIPLGIEKPEIFSETKGDRIPRIIHQTWKTEEIPTKFTKWINSWVRNHQGWTYYLWTDDSARQLIKERHPHLLKVFNGYHEGIRRADALRYIVMYEFGGVYADMDLESLQSVEPFIRKYSCILSQEPYEHPIMDGNFEHLVINALLACRPKHPLMKQLMDSLPAFQHMWNVLDSTGPHFVTLVFRDYTNKHPLPDSHLNGTYLAPAEYFFPTIDPAKFFWFHYKCGQFLKLSQLQQKACKTMKLKGLRRKPLPFSFTNHHWEHTYLDLRLSLKGPVNIHDTVPNVIIYKGKVEVE